MNAARTKFTVNEGGIIILSVIVSCLVLLGLQLALRAPGALHASRPLSDVDPSLPGIAIPMEIQPEAHGVFRASARIHSRAPLLRSAGEIRFHVGTYGPDATIKEVSLKDPCTATTLFDARPGVLVNNQEIILRRVSPTGGEPVDPACGLEGAGFPLDVVFAGPERLAIWTQIGGASSVYEANNLVLSVGTQRGVIWGTWISSASVAPVSRWRLLLEMWGGSAWLPALAGFSFLLLFSAALVTWRGSALTVVVLLGLGVAISYAWICPPFQAPDEPDHFLTLANDVPGSGLAERALTLANKGHFESIKFRPGVSFSAEGIGRPLTGDWASHVTATGAQEARSPVAGLTWPVIARVIAPLDAAAALFVLRGLNVGLFVLVFAFFAWSCVTAGGADEWGSRLALLMLGIPVLPFFAMHWSNHVFSLFAIIAAGALLVRAMSGLESSWRIAFAEGAVAGLAFVSGVTGMACAFMFVVLVMFGSGLRSWDKKAFAPATAVSFGTGAFLPIVATGTNHRYVSVLLERLALLVPESMRPGLMNLPVAPATYGLIVTGFVLAPLAAGMIGAGVSRRISSPQGYRATQAGHVLAKIEFVVWMVFLAMSVFMRGPELPGIEGEELHGISMFRYAVKAAGAFLFGFGFGPSDILVVDSFWGGFGWLDAQPPGWLLRFCRLVPAIGISWILFRAATKTDSAMRRLWLWLNGTTAAVVLAVMVMAAATYSMNVNLHGRYLAGAYFLFLLPACIGFSRWTNASRQLMVLGVLSVHSVCWYSLILRYLGSS